ncbi:MAG: hypothetical protein LC117_00575 [Bacteroidia bacterium]|nr:hypothetical protein [Ignavibacteria bacterium]MCZ2276411.1 hypothetical protein [Bacteroidia bacterium]
MNNNKLPENIIRYSLSILLLLVALNAFAGGYYGMAGAKTVPTEWLKGSPFRNYFIPGLFLFVVVGGSALLAAIFILIRHHLAQKVASACGIIILLWLLVQVVIIGYVSWMQPTTAVTAVIILLLTWQLKKYGH